MGQCSFSKLINDAESSPSIEETRRSKPSNLLADRTIIVTGAATGIGQAFALGCSAQGANVVVADINAADETVAAIEHSGGNALAVRVDIADSDSMQAMAATALERFGRINGLVNNAAYFREVKLTPFEDLDSAQWDRIFAVNVKGVWQCCKAVMPAMRHQGSGSIVNISSVVAVAGQPGYLHYVTTKGAVLSMTKGLAKEVGPYGVRVNVIAPGFVITNATRNRPVEWQQSFLKARAIARATAHRLGRHRALLTVRFVRIHLWADDCGGRWTHHVLSDSPRFRPVPIRKTYEKKL